MYYYASDKTADLLNSKDVKVYLYGGSIGTHNFGDIVQLKNIIQYIRDTLGVEPIIFLSAYYLDSKQSASLYEKRYQVKNVVFMSAKLMNPDNVRLGLVKRVNTGGLLHVYGGGYLNENWGKGHIDRIASILRTFGVKEYVFSGQQIGEAIIPQLEELFKVKKPLIFGVRDEVSQKIMAGTTVAGEVRFSFDDVAEIFDSWRRTSQLGLKKRILNHFLPKKVLWHPNFSYHSDNQQDVLKLFKRVRKDMPGHQAVIAHAWADKRALRIFDGISAVSQFTDQFPYANYEVINFARLAYQIDTSKNKYPSLADYFSKVDMCISSSYHIAMLAAVFDIPTYLLSSNEYYSQKQKGLGIDYTIDQFLAADGRHKIDLDKRFKQRAEWVVELSQVLNSSRSSFIEPGRTKTIVSNQDITEDLPKVPLLSIESR